LTHERESEPDRIARQFLEGISPLSSSGRLGAVLVQFPYSFKPSARNRDYIKRLGELLGGLEEKVVEFRNARWLVPETYELLNSAGFGFCAVDEPPLRGLVPPVTVVTSRIGYLRFHGRNAGKWFEHEQAWERYDYLYSEEELLEWIPRVRKMGEQADVIYIFTNNHRNGQAVTNARQLRLLLGLEPRLPAGKGAV